MATDRARHEMRGAQATCARPTTSPRRNRPRGGVGSRRRSANSAGKANVTETFPFFVQDAYLAVSPKPTTRQFNWVLSAAVRGCTSICCYPLELHSCCEGGGLDPPGLHSYTRGGGHYLSGNGAPPLGAKGGCPKGTAWASVAREWKKLGVLTTVLCKQEKGRY